MSGAIMPKPSFTTRFQHCIKTESLITISDQDQLESLKGKLADEMGAPFGLHTMGLPAATSVLAMVLSFTLPQYAIWSVILNFFSLPSHTVLAWIFFTAILFSGVNAITVFLIGKGRMCALKVHLMMAGMTLLLAITYFIGTLLATFDSTWGPGFGLTSAVVSLAFITVSILCIRSNSFYLMLLYSLHNRAFRKLNALRKHV